MGSKLKRIAVTGGAGQIAYSLIFRIAHGDLLGPNQPVALHLLDVPDAMPSLKGVVMELEDCVFPLLKEVKIGSNPEEIFGEVDHALLVGAKPRGPGMERKELLADNGKIFVEQGKALNKAASRGVQVIVVGNPANTNCLIAMHHAPDLPRENFHSMMRLDQNRAVFQLAHKAGVPLHDVTHVAIWGNHSSTQVPDYAHAKIRGVPVPDVIHDKNWLEQTFVQTVQKRGAQVISARGKSSAASAANAIIGSVRSFLNPTHAEDWFSAGGASEGNPYGIEDGLVFSFPCVSKGHGDYEIISGLHIDSSLQQKIHLTEKELIEERNLVAHLLR